MGWRVAKTLLKLEEQVNAAAPGRSKSSDGKIGDASHQASPSSDHNPFIKDPQGIGVVRAFDITHDPRNGLDAYALAETFRLSDDDRINYIISNRKIANPGEPWRKYIGKNPHSLHTHVSVSKLQDKYDNIRPWQIGKLVPQPSAPIATSYPLLKRGSKGEVVKVLQKSLLKQGFYKDKIDGDFGLKTEAAAKAFQKSVGLTADGKVGNYTWLALKGKL